MLTFYFLFKKVDVHAHYTPVRDWRSRYWNNTYLIPGHLMPKHDISSCLWKCHHVLFLMMWHKTAYGGRIIVSGCFFFIFFFSLSCQIKCTIVLFVFAFSILVLILLVSYFILIPFIKVLFVFDLVLQLKFLICFSFHFDPFFSWLFC